MFSPPSHREENDYFFLEKSHDSWNDVRLKKTRRRRVRDVVIDERHKGNLWSILG